MLVQTAEDVTNEGGLCIRCRVDDSLFNLQRLQTHMETLDQLILDLQLVNDAVLVGHTA